MTIDNKEKFDNLKELIKEYYELVKANPNRLEPYAEFKNYKNRCTEVKAIIKKLNESNDDNVIAEIMKLWATGGEIHINDSKEEYYKSDKLIHSVSNTVRLQVCIQDGKKTDKGTAVNRENLIKFAKAIGEFITNFEPSEPLEFKHDLINNSDFKDLLNNNIDAAINEILFWYYYDEDKYPLINRRATKSRSILNNIFLENTSKNDHHFNEKCKKLIGEPIATDDYKITKQLLLDQLFYSIDEMKSMKKVDEAYNDKTNVIYKFYQKLWNTIKDTKIVSNADFFNDLLEKSKNIILYGAPGTGKTYTSKTNIENIIDSNPNPEIDEIRFKIIQFHPSYSYEDFMEGIKPVSNNGQVSLELVEGDFMKFCKDAKEHEGKYKEDNKTKMKYAFFFLVDEINRAELSRVFGELMYALDKRGNQISTQYSYLKESNKEFNIPENLYFIGTMNDVDRSIDSFDIALRRRFLWYRMDCDYSVIFNELENKYSNIGQFGNKNIPDSGYLKACYDLNQFITEKKDGNLGLGKTYELGHSYFMNINLHINTTSESKKVKIENRHLKSLFQFSIEPLLKEYIRSQYDETEIEMHLETAKKTFILSEGND